jgi:hypothetical protein
LLSQLPINNVQKGSGEKFENGERALDSFMNIRLIACSFPTFLHFLQQGSGYIFETFRTGSGYYFEGVSYGPYR